MNKRWSICHPCEPTSPRGMVSLVSRVLITNKLWMADAYFRITKTASTFRLWHTDECECEHTAVEMRQMGNKHARYREWEEWERQPKTAINRAQSQKAWDSNRSRSDMDHTVLRVSRPEAFSCEVWAVMFLFSLARAQDVVWLQRGVTRLHTPSPGDLGGMSKQPFALVHTPRARPAYIRVPTVIPSRDDDWSPIHSHSTLHRNPEKAYCHPLGGSRISQSKRKNLSKFLFFYFLCFN